MAKTKKLTVNCRKGIDELCRSKGIETDLALLRRMAKYIDTQGMNKYEWAEKNRSHFSEKINGKRAFTTEDVIAFERATGVAFLDVIDPAEAPIKMAKRDFQPSGIRYAAYRDDPALYRQLWEDIDADEYRVICNSDEFEKHLTDYIVEYNAKGGLRFLIETEVFPGRGYLYFDVGDGRWEGSFHHMEQLSEGLWRMLMEMDDVELFKRAALHLWHDTGYSPFYQWSEGTEEAYLPSLLRTHAIRECALEPFVGDGKPNAFLVLILHYALRKRDAALSQAALKQYEEMIEKQIERVLPHLTENDLECAGFVGHEMLHFRDKRIYFADVEMLAEGLENNGEWGEIKHRLAALSGGCILDRMRRKDVKEMQVGERFLDRLHRCEIVKTDADAPTAEIEMLLYMQACGYTGVPMIASKGDGVFEIEKERDRWNDYNRSNGSLAPAIRILSRIHLLSAQVLKAGRVYLHGPFYPSDIGENKIWHWQNCHIGDAFEDLAEALLSLTDLCGQDLGRHDAKQTMKAISDAFSEYEIAENVKDLGTRFCDWLYARLSECKQKGDHDEHRRLSLARSFAEMNREALNELRTKSVHADA